MQQEIKSKDCSLAGASDLTVVAPIRKGFVPGLDAVTYKTRVQRVLKTLHAGRSGLHESELARMLSDAVERVGRIHSVRIAVLEPHDQVLLAVTFDGAWESYVRVIWQKVARLLDLIFCNTENYVNGWESSFEDWGAWLRSRQAETAFLYALPGLSVDDTVYLRASERLARTDGGSDLPATRLLSRSAEEIADALFSEGRDPTTFPPGRRLHAKTETQPAVFRQGLRSLAGLYRLADVYPPTSNDGVVLLRAAHELLPEFAHVAGGKHHSTIGWNRAEQRFREPLTWFVQKLPTPAARAPSLPPAVPTLPASAQGGILEPYPDVDHGVVLLVSFDSPAAAAALAQAAPPTLRTDQHALNPGDLTCNLAFSLEGLRAAGLTDAEIASFPTEFVQGMDKRAGVLGDVRVNHPRSWRLPVRNWADGIAAADAADDAAGERVPLRAVHALVQLRRIRTSAAQTRDQARAELLHSLQHILSKAPGVRPLSLQWLHRLHSGGGTGKEILDHFGFRDSTSDPVFHGKDAGGVYPNHVHAGEALIGYPNAADTAAPRWPGASDWTRSLVADGSFLVVRKLRLDLSVLEDVLLKAQTDTGLDRPTLLAKMMGRWPEDSATPGEPLATRPPAPVNANDFRYQDDAEGMQCPLHAHMRRANPRDVPPPAQRAGSRPPRLFRRSLSYGPAFDPKEPDAKKRAAALLQERGLFFVAYNASLGEQFEVVQRWLSGGNSAKGYSGQSDPFLGVPEPGRPRWFRFEHAGKTVRMALDGSDDLLAEPKPLVRLEWGGYFFAPSFTGLRLLERRAAEAAARTPLEPLAWSVEQGERAIAELRRIEATEGAAVAAREWKAALEDAQAAADFKTASIWAAIRARHAGLLRTPYGVLVAGRDGVDSVLRNTQELLTSTAYLPRMRQSFGAIYLGMDPGQEDRRYETESAACNAAIRALADTDARYQGVFEDARAAVVAKLLELVTNARAYAQEDEQLRLNFGLQPRDRLAWELTVDVRELVDELLATFCEKWFGLERRPGLLDRSGFRWTWQPGEPACYPGHFMAPSRYIFQPHPESEVEARGIAHGQGMRQAMSDFLGTPGAGSAAPVSSAVLAAYPSPQDRPLVARILVGAMMGMVPTIDANLRRVLDRWLTEGTLWTLRSRLAGVTGQPLRDAIELAFRQAMQSRVAPDTLWRTVQRGGQIKDSSGHAFQLHPGEVVVAGLASAAQERMEGGDPPDVAVAFGATGIAPHPAHSCPGYRPALAMMEGFAAALVGFDAALRPGPGALSFVISGYEAYVPPVAPAGLAGFTLVGKRDAHSEETLLAAGATKVWTYGDSWVETYWPMRPPGRSTLAHELRDLGYLVESEYSSSGTKLEEMADNVGEIAGRLRAARAGEVDALLVGGGGNDVTNTMVYESAPLYDLLIRGSTSAAAALDAQKVHDFIDVHLHEKYVTVLTALVAATQHLGIPIVVHAYANPVADGRAASVGGIGFGRAWLEPVFQRRQMTDRIVNTEVMRILIGRLNTMVQKVIQDLASPRVHYVNLRGHLIEQWTAARTHEADWADELHPTPGGFATLAAQIAARLPATVKL